MGIEERNRKLKQKNLKQALSEKAFPKYLYRHPIVDEGITSQTFKGISQQTKSHKVGLEDEKQGSLDTTRIGSEKEYPAEILENKPADNKIEQLKREIENFKKEYDKPMRMGRDMKVRLLLIEKEAELKGRQEQKQEDDLRFLKILLSLKEDFDDENESYMYGALQFIHLFFLMFRLL